MAEKAIGRIRLGISTCLLGERVRYDGGHKYDPFLVETLGQYVEYVPVCPESDCGMPIPRESLRLEGDPENPRLMTHKTRQDLTEMELSWARRRVVELEKEDLDGYVFKSKSPSSGMERVKVYLPGGMAVKKGVGLWARVFMEHFPLLPVEEEGRLNDPRLRDNFIERIFIMKRWREMLATRRDRGGMVDFHTRHKLLILSHSTRDYEALGRIVAGMKGRDLGAVHQDYFSILMPALKLIATARKHVNVLQHAMGYFKKDLTADEKTELIEMLDHYRNGHVPLIVPITLINHYVRKYDQAYLREQLYLNPHPIELQLRNHV